MTMKLWHWLLAVAALVVPLQAVALDGGSGGSLSASASLGYCGVANTGVSCQINVSWGGIEDAQRYTATATLADGSVSDLGTVGVGSGGGSTSIWVPYVGDGTYGITITAWGSDEGDAKKLDEGEAKIEASDEIKPGEEIEDPAPEDEEKAEDPAGEDDEEDPAEAPPETTTPEPTDPTPEPTDPVPTEPVPVPEPTPEPEPVPEQPPADDCTPATGDDATPCPAVAPLG